MTLLAHIALLIIVLYKWFDFDDRINSAEAWGLGLIGTTSLLSVVNCLSGITPFPWADAMLCAGVSLHLGGQMVRRHTEAK